MLYVSLALTTLAMAHAKTVKLENSAQLRSQATRLAASIALKVCTLQWVALTASFASLEWIARLMHQGPQLVRLACQATTSLVELQPARPAPRCTSAHSWRPSCGAQSTIGRLHTMDLVNHAKMAKIAKTSPFRARTPSSA